MAIHAVFFDLDGVLVDAVDWHKDAFNLALQELYKFKLTAKEHKETFNGLPTLTKLEILQKEKRIPKRADFTKFYALKQKYTRDLINKNCRYDYSKHVLFSTLDFKDIYTICVTNCSIDTAKLMLEKSGISLFGPDYIISNEMFNHPKPCSEGYVMAHMIAQVNPDEVIIVEDSPKGVEAAKNTGAYVWQVNNAKNVTLDNLYKFMDEEAIWFKGSEWRSVSRDNHDF